MPTNERHRSRLSPSARAKILDGVVIPKKPIDDQRDADPTFGGVWYQTSNTTPFLYLPPVHSYDELSSGVKIAHFSLDVLIAVRTPGNARIVLAGYFNYAIYQWAYHGIDAREYDEYTPHYWRFMPILPLGWRDDDVRGGVPLAAPAGAPDRSNDDA